MSVYQRDDPALFLRAVESVFRNTVVPDRFVLVIDGPIPNLLRNAVDRILDAHNVTVVQIRQQRGLANALNEGLLHVNTVWVARADADDFNVPARFELQAKALMEDQNLDVLGGAILEVNTDGCPIAQKSVPMTHNDIVAYAKRRNPFNHMTVMFRRVSVLDVGGYPDILFREDYALWAQMISRGLRLRNLKQVLVHATAGAAMYRRRGGVRYALAEIALQKMLHQCGLKSKREATFDVIRRGGVFLLPAFVRGRLYQLILREKPARDI